MRRLQQTWLPGYRRETGRALNVLGIIVPTIDTIRAAWLLDLFITHGQHVLCVGDTGTGIPSLHEPPPPDAVPHTSSAAGKPIC